MQTIRNLKLYQKFLVGFIFLVLLMGLVSAYVGLFSNKLHQEIIKQASISSDSQALVRYSQESFGLVSRYALTQNPKELGLFKPRLAAALYASQQRIDSLRSNHVDSYGLSVIEKYMVVAQEESIALMYDHDLELGLASQEKVDQKKLATIQDSERQHILAIQDAQAKTEGAIEDLLKTTKNSFDGAEVSYKQSEFISRVVLVGGVIFAILLSFLFSSLITRPINSLIKAVTAISAGDLSSRAEVTSHDEIGQLAGVFNQMIDRVNDTSTQLKAKAEEAIDTSKQFETKNQSLESTEKAMLNILEDARGLEEALKIEKEGVEKKVIERTSQLKEEQARLEASINSLEVGFIMTDIKPDVLMMNSVAGRMLCLAESNIEPGGALKGPVNLQCDIQMMQKALDGVFPLIDNIQNCIKAQKPIDVKVVNFRERVFHIFIAPIIKLEQTLQVIGAVILIEDITEAKLLERSRDEFFSIASHELRTPLTAIRGNTSLIQQFYADKLKDPELKEMVDDIHESSTRLIAIVNDFLDTSRLELGKMQFKNSCVDMVELSKDVIKEYITTGSVKNLYLKLEEPTVKLPNVFADKDRTKQVLINLVGNSLKFTDTGGITIVIQPEDKYLKVLISDTGRGVSEEGKNLLFKKFQQTGSSLYTRDTFRGTGLGLYISKLIIEGMGGQIKLEKSEVGKGSTFSVRLPICTPEQQTACVHESAAALPASIVPPATSEPSQLTKDQISQLTASKSTMSKPTKP